MATSAPTLPLHKQRDLEYANRHGILGLIPGIALLAAVGYAGKFIEQSIARYGKAHHQTLPNIEYVLWAILIGVLIANTVGLPRIFRAGVATYEFWLKAGIILLGARFILGDILHLSGISFVLIFIELLLALTFMTYLGRHLSFHRSSSRFWRWDRVCAEFRRLSRRRGQLRRMKRTLPLRLLQFWHSGLSRLFSSP